MRRALFVRTGNRARSQMAEGILRHLARKRCPTFPGEGMRLHWSVEDPADAEASGAPRPAAFRAARDDLWQRIGQFAREQGQ